MRRGTIRSRSPVRSDAQLAQRAEQWKVQRGADRLGAELRSQCRVAFELRAVALRLALEEVLEAAKAMKDK